MARRITDVDPRTGGKRKELGTTYTRAELREMAKRPGARVKGSVLRRTGDVRVAKRLGVKASDVRGMLKGKGGDAVTILARKGGRKAVKGRKG